MALATAPHTTFCPHPRTSAWYQRGSSHRVKHSEAVGARPCIAQLSSRAIEALQQMLCHARQQGKSVTYFIVVRGFCKPGRVQSE